MNHFIHNPSAELIEQIKKSGTPVVSVTEVELKQIMQQGKKLSVEHALQKLKTYKPSLR